MKNKTIGHWIGIDPGISGGGFVISNFGHSFSNNSTNFSTTEHDIWEWISEYSIGSNPTFAVIEKVHAMPGNGVSSMFKFGRSYGFLRGCLIAAGIPFEEVTPQAWQKALGIPKRSPKEKQTEFKNRMKAMAQQLYPSKTITLATADAALLATYCHRKRTGTL